MPTLSRILLTGCYGQLGTECRLLAPNGCSLIAIDREELDLGDATQISKFVWEVQPSMILHTAAWTAVDLAESSEMEAYALNATATAVLAETAASIGARMAYISTDYVFSGHGTVPWHEHDPVAPLNAYGRTKLAGEQAVLAHLGDRGHVVRTSWLYGRRGANFVRTMLGLMEQSRELKVVSDQLGTPTWAGGLAKALFALATADEAPSILHYTDGGITSWCEFATEIRAAGLRNGLALESSSVVPCPSSAYPTPAARPAWSPLHFSDAWADLGIKQTPWQEALERALKLLLQEDDRISQ
jgi:dTDP-4-dehydrorhamnose reductase